MWHMWVAEPMVVWHMWLAEPIFVWPTWLRVLCFWHMYFNVATLMLQFEAHMAYHVSKSIYQYICLV